MATDSAAPLATAEDISDVETVRDPERAQAALSIRLTDAAAARLRKYTTEHVGEHVVISLGDRVVAKLTVRDPVDSPVLVTGSTPEDVAQMRAKLCGS